MDTNSQCFAGLDLGSTKVRVVIGQVNKDQLEILGSGECTYKGDPGVNKGVVTILDNTAEAIEAAMKDAMEQANTDVYDVIVNVSGSKHQIQGIRNTITRNTQENGTGISERDMFLLQEGAKLKVSSPGNELLHLIPQDFSTEEHKNIYSPIGYAGIEFSGNYKGVLIPQNSLRLIKESVGKVKTPENKPFEVIGIVFSPLATAMAVLTAEQKKEGVALVDIGGGTIEIAIYHKNILRHVAVLPIGGDSITNDIRQGCRVREQYASLLKEKFGTTQAKDVDPNKVVSVPGLAGQPHTYVPLRNLAYIIEARSKEIASMVLAVIEESGYLDKILGGIVLTGGGANLKGIDLVFKELAKDTFVSIGYPNHKVSKIPADNTLVNTPAYSTAIGLVWQGLKDVDSRIVSEIVEKPKSINTVEHNGKHKPLPEPEPAKAWWQKAADFFTDSSLREKDV